MMRGGVRLLIGTVVSLQIAAAAEREWTSVEGKTIQGEILKVEGNTVTLKKGEKAFVFPLERLSEADRKVARDWAAKAPASAKKGPRKDWKSGLDTTVPGNWPKEVSSSLTEAQILEMPHHPGDREYIYQTPNFRFRSEKRLSKSVIREFAKVFEATHAMVDALPFGMTPTKGYLQDRFEVRLFESNESARKAGMSPQAAATFQYYARGHPKSNRYQVFGEAFVPLPTIGVRWTGTRFTVDYNDRDHTVVVHELAHQLSMWWLRQMPQWMTEGFAEFVAGIPYKRGTYRLRSVTRSIKERVAGKKSREYRMIAPSSLLPMTRGEWEQFLKNSPREARRLYGSCALLMTYFALLDGNKDGAHVLAFLRARAEGVSLEAAQAKHLLRGRTPEQLDKEIVRAWRGEGLQLETMPVSSR